MFSISKPHMHREAFVELTKSIGLWAATAFSAVGTFFTHALPILQASLCIIGLVSGFYSIQASRATIKKNKSEKGN